jgi:hypothetical protein
VSLLGGVRDLAQDHGLWWPGGDPGGCRHLGDAWLRAAAACEMAIEALDHAIRRVRLDDSGAAVDAFTQHGHRMMTELSEEAERLRRIGHSLLERADQIDHARRQVEALVAQIAASVVAGAALAIFTGGVSEALAAEAAAALVAEAAALELTFSEAAISLTARIAAYAAMGAWEGGVIDVVGQTGRTAVLHQNPFTSFSLAEGWQATVLGAGTNGIIGGLTHLPPLPPSLPVVGMVPEEAEVMATRIARGHAWQKHVIEQGEFPLITTPEEFAVEIRRILERPSIVRRLSVERWAYWDEGRKTLVIVHPSTTDGGTAFVPSRGIDYFEKELRR